MVKKLFRFFVIGFLIVCLGLLIMPKEVFSQQIWAGGNTYHYYGQNGQAYREPSQPKDSVFKKTFLSYMEEYRDACWFCPVFAGTSSSSGSSGSSGSGSSSSDGGIYGAINKLTKVVFNNMALDFLSLMGVGILFLIIFKVGKMLVQLQEVDVMQFLNDLFKPLGRAIIASALLGVSVAAGHQTIFYLLTNPVFDASVRLGEKVLETTLGEVKILKTSDNDIDSRLDDNLKGQIKWEELDTKAEAENSQQGGDNPLEEAPKLALIQWMKSVSSSFIVGIALGGSFVSAGLDNFFGDGGLSMFLAGLIIWGGFWLIYLMFPFKLIDSFVRIAVALALMPLWIVLWVFPATQGYTKKAWEMFLSSCLTFTVLSVMIAISLMLISNIVPDPLYSAGGSISRSEFFRKLCTTDTLDDAIKYAGFGSGLCMNALAFTAMSFSLISAASGIANSFVGGGANIQTNVGAGMAASAATVGRVSWSAAKATGKVSAWAGSKAHDAWTSRGSRHVSTGTFGGATGNNNNGGSGSGSGGGGGGGDTPPPTNPTGLPPSDAGRREADIPPRPEGTGIPYDSKRPAFEQLSGQDQNDVSNRAAAQENALYAAKDDPENRQQLMAGAGPEQRRVLKAMDKAIKRNRFDEVGKQRDKLKEAIAKDILTGKDPETIRRQQAEARTRGAEGHGTATPDASATGRTETPADSASMTPERAQAVKELAKDASAPQKFEKLSADVAFVEQSLSAARGRDEFMQAIQNHHDWQSGDSKAMVSFAERLYDANKNGNDAQARRIVKEFLSPHLDGTTAGWNTNGQIAAKVETAVKDGGPGRILSDQLHALSLQITAAQTASPRR